MEKSKSDSFIRDAETAWQDLGGGLSRKMLGYDDELMMVKVKFEKGAVGEPHSHFHSQVSYVLEGTFEITIGDEKKKLSVGDVFYVPPHAIHSAVCLEQGILLDVFSPVREDFL